jgi:putative glycosyl hydrolase-like family 15 (GHL15) protein
MDYGNHAYQQTWIRNVLADVRAHGWDGVAVDNALTTADAYGIAEKYPNDTSVQAATYSALQVTGRGLRRAGTGSVFNVGYTSRFPGLWQRWLRRVGGLEQEFYLASASGSSAIDAAWRGYELEIASCATLRKSCFFRPAEVPASDASQYALASYMIAASGRQLLGVENMATLAGPCWRLGAPQGRGQPLGPAWRRFFKRGVAIVNPTSEPVTIPLRDSYVDERGRAVREVTLQPASGAVLRTTSSEPRGLTGNGGMSGAEC